VTQSGWLRDTLELRWLTDRALRRRVAVVVSLLLLLLTFFPRPYRASVSLTPLDQSAAGLAPALAGLGAFASFLGNQQISEVHLRVGRSVEVRRDVVVRMNLAKAWGTRDEAALLRRLDREITIRTLRGGILVLETKNRDADYAQRLIQAYLGALQDRLGVLSREQTAYKRNILADRLKDANDRLKAAEKRLDQFRLANESPDPSNALAAVGRRLPALKELLRSKEMQLQVAKQFETENNYSVQTILAEIQEVKRQMAIATAPGVSEQVSVERIVARTTELNYLMRDVHYARVLYDSYQRLLEGTSLEDLISRLNLRVIEPPHIEPDIQINYPALALLAAYLAIVLAFEFNLVGRRSASGR
jgi:hypothetical protein